MYSFVWDEFCDWYIELSKINMNNTTKSILIYTLSCILKMLHPFMPYVTEEIYTKLFKNESIMISSYPEFNKEQIFEREEEMLNNIIELIKKYVV